MTTEQMRAELQKAYPGMEWKLKVIKMSEYQVIAIYRRMKKAGTL